MVGTIEVFTKGIKSLKGIEHFRNLSALNCFLNFLTELDVSKNVRLRTLFCDDNNIRELDLSMNSSLKTFSCHGNALATLDLSGCPRGISCI